MTKTRECPEKENKENQPPLSESYGVGGLSGGPPGGGEGGCAGCCCCGCWSAPCKPNCALRHIAVVLSSPSIVKLALDHHVSERSGSGPKLSRSPEMIEGAPLTKISPGGHEAFALVYLAPSPLISILWSGPYLFTVSTLSSK